MSPRRKPSVRAHGRLSRRATRSLGRSRCTRSRRRARAVHGRPRSATDGLEHFTRKGPAAARLVASSSPAGAPRPASHHLAARGTAVRCVDRFTSLHESSRTAARRRRPFPGIAASDQMRAPRPSSRRRRRVEESCGTSDAVARRTTGSSTEPCCQAASARARGSRTALFSAARRGYMSGPSLSGALARPRAAAAAPAPGA